MLGLCFLTVTPCWMTSCGRRACADVTRFLRQHVRHVLVRADLEVDVELHAAVAVFDDFM
jgi:hypothetical protein